MAAQTVLRSVQGAAGGLVPIRRALVSVFDKGGVTDVVKNLVALDVEIVSTGGTAATLRDAGVPVVDVEELTGTQQILDGRVKTLHPAVHGSLLAVRGNAGHEEDLRNTLPEAFSDPLGIDCVIANLYPFEQAVRQFSSDPATIVENIDVGGPTMLRAAAKNHAHVLALPSPRLYEAFLRHIEETSSTSGEAVTDAPFRQAMAAATFSLLSQYDGHVASWLAGGAAGACEVPSTSTRVYVKQHSLKYGNNPHQKPAAVATLPNTTPPTAIPDKFDSPSAVQVGLGAGLPYSVENGAPGYINLLDALNAWQLVKELAHASEEVHGACLPAAASFKHVSPAGAALGVPLERHLSEVYGVTSSQEEHMTPLAAAYIRARQCDPLCSFGDFVAVSHVVDEATARVLKPEVSDGIIAPGFTPEALALLRSKKQGGYIMIAMDPDYDAPAEEWREVFGVALCQRRNTQPVTASMLRAGAVSGPPLDGQALLDALVANITVKYTQSNSVGFALGGQMVGVGAGQQSRVDCVKLAGQKVATWWMRQHPRVRALPFKAGVKRQARVNARVRYIEGGMTEVERAAWSQHFDAEPDQLTAAEKVEWMQQLQGVTLASDAFFPFRDGIDTAARFGVSSVVQPGGSVGDAAVLQAAQEHGMSMAYTGTRLFHH